MSSQEVIVKSWSITMFCDIGFADEKILASDALVSANRFAEINESLVEVVVSKDNLDGYLEREVLPSKFIP